MINKNIKEKSYVLKTNKISLVLLGTYCENQINHLEVNKKICESINQHYDFHMCSLMQIMCVCVLMLFLKIDYIGVR